MESANLYSSEESGSARRRSLVDGSVFGYEERHLQLSDLRIPLLFVSLWLFPFVLLIVVYDPNSIVTTQHKSMEAIRHNAFMQKWI